MITELDDPSINCNLISGMLHVRRWRIFTKVESMSESEDPESTRDARETLGKVLEDNDNIRESGFERADMPSVTVLA